MGLKSNKSKKAPQEAPVEQVEELIKEEKTLNFKKSVIQWFDKDFRLTGEKMVSQDPFIYAKHKLEPHDGPMRLTFSFETQDDAKRVAEFILQLTGVLPMDAPRKSSIGKVSEEDIQSPKIHEEILAAVKGMTNRDDVIKFLKGKGFVFLSNEFIVATELLELDDYDLPSGNMSAMVLRIRESKTNPLLDKFDPTMVIFIDLIATGTTPVSIWSFGSLSAQIEVDVKERSTEIKEFIKFPQYIIHEERLKISQEVRQIMMGTKKQPSKLLLRWYEYIDFPLDVKEKLDYLRGDLKL